MYLEHLMWGQPLSRALTKPSPPAVNTTRDLEATQESEVTDAGQSLALLTREAGSSFLAGG